MIGKQIPAGTGFKNIRDLEFKDTREENTIENLMDDQTKELFNEISDEEII